MANAKRSRKSRRRAEPAPRTIPAEAVRWARRVLPLLGRVRRPRRRSAQHLRQATIEVLEAMRALLDETITWLEHEGKARPELKRIRVEG